MRIVTIIANGTQALTFVPEGNKELTDMFARWSIAYSKVLMCHLREDGDVQKTMEVSSADNDLFSWFMHLIQGRLQTCFPVTFHVCNDYTTNPIRW